LKNGSIVKFVKKKDKNDVINGEIINIDKEEGKVYFTNTDYPESGKHSFTLESLSKYYNIIPSKSNK